MFEYAQKMQRMCFYSRIGAHRQSWCALESGGALNQLAPQGQKVFELPQRRTPFGAVALRHCRHMPPSSASSVEVMRQHGHKDKHLVAGLAADRDVVHLSLRLQFDKDAYLGATAIVYRSVP